MTWLKYPRKEAVIERLAVEAEGFLGSDIQEKT
jgi:hypothetical protein